MLVALFRFNTIIHVQYTKITKDIFMQINYEYKTKVYAEKNQTI